MSKQAVFVKQVPKRLTERGSSNGMEKVDHNIGTYDPGFGHENILRCCKFTFEDPADYARSGHDLNCKYHIVWS